MNHIAKLGVAAGLFMAASGSVGDSGARYFASDDPRGSRPVTVTASDVDASNKEAAAAFNSLVAMWDGEFKRIGERFHAPRLARYRGATRSACGVLPASNAVYCDRANAIYFDDVFLAGEAKITGAALGSDGDMAAVGIIAHEMGHAVAAQLGVRFRSSYASESAADCLAGAFANYAQREGSLEKGDLEEAFYAMAAAADPEMSSTGNARRDARRVAMLSRQSHGTREQRQANFRAGFERGGGACVAELR